MWEKVAKRSHKPQQLYAFGSGSDDIMLYGTVDYELKDGKETNVEWAARAHFTNAEGELKMDFYQVYLVSDSTILKRTLSSDSRHRIQRLCLVPSRSTCTPWTSGPLRLLRLSL